MAAYTVINELQSIAFHDSSLDNAYIEESKLHMLFSAAIMIGHSRLDIKGRIPCSVNVGEGLTEPNLYLRLSAQMQTSLAARTQ